MTTTDVLEATLVVALFVFAVLVLVSLASMRWRRYRGQSWREYGPRLLRYVGIRLGLAIGIAGAFFILVLAALTLNTHRPPGDTNPLIRIKGAPGPVTVKLSVNQCGDPVYGLLTLSPLEGKATRASIYSDQDGLQKVRLNDLARGRFELSGATAKRGILSCYLELPLITGDTGDTEIRLKLGDDQEVDALASIPAPAGYRNGVWQWRCEAGNDCPALATFGASVESGAKQVIVLVLAAVFGAIIAVFIAEMLLEPVRRRLERIAAEKED